MELLLPVALMLFPGMLPSTFTEESKEVRRFSSSIEYIDVTKVNYLRHLSIVDISTHGQFARNVITVTVSVRVTLKV